MATQVLQDRELVRGSARLADLCYVLSKGKELLEKDVAHTSIIGLYRGNWAKAVTVHWNSTAIAVAKRPSEVLVVVGEDGQVCTYVGGKADDEALSPRPRLIRNARTIKGEVYACGMKRQVYRRVGEKRWTDMSAPVPAPDERVGFEAVDGYHEEEVYAVGWAGEIWHYDGMQWRNCASPTNRILTAVCCAPDGLVYVAGQQGVMLRGRRDAWELVAWDEEVGLDLWDLCWFDDKLYVAAINGLFTFEGNALEPVDFGDAGVPSCYSLTTAEGVLWSIGRDDVASFDGVAWRRYA